MPTPINSIQVQLVLQVQMQDMLTYMNGQLKYLVTNYLTPQNNITENHFYYPSELDY